MARLRYRNVCYTLNNYAPGDRERILADPRITYGVVGYEVGEELGTPHHQGFLEFADQLTFKQVKALLGNEAHFERKYPNSTVLRASNYCKKGTQTKIEWNVYHEEGENFGVDADFIEVGEMSRQGSRSDIAEPVALITSGVPLKRVAREHPEAYVRFHRGFHALKAILVEPRTTMPAVSCYFGTSGTGKSHEAHVVCNDDPFIWGPNMGTWFDGSEGQSQAIFEEYRGDFAFGFLMQLLDKYSCRVQIKGASIEFCATTICFTSPMHPRLWYIDRSDDSTLQLRRRLSSIILCTENDGVFSQQCVAWDWEDCPPAP